MKNDQYFLKRASKSEDHGISLLNDKDLLIYSVGVSTGGVAEIRMAQTHSRRKVIATTIDENGIPEAQKFIEEHGFSDQITVKLEDVSKKLSYSDNYFDCIYARLVLHYLPKKILSRTLNELHRILKPKGKLYIVVRSDKCPDAKREGKTYDDTTGLTTYPMKNPKTGVIYTQSRFFHTPESIKYFVERAGFKIKHVKSYNERLFIDFMRTVTSPHEDHVIELVGYKETI